MDADSLAMLIAVAILVALYSTYQNSGTFASIFLFPIVCLGFATFFLYLLARGGVVGDVVDLGKSGLKTVEKALP